MKDYLAPYIYFFILFQNYELIYVGNTIYLYKYQLNATADFIINIKKKKHKKFVANTVDIVMRELSHINTVDKGNYDII